MKKLFSIQRRNQIFHCGLCLLIFQLLVINFSTVFAQTRWEDGKRDIKAFVENLTPEQKVGQLFLVTFEGNQLSPDSKIIDLITNHFISGVILKRENDNFTGPEKTLENSIQLITSLQNAAAGLFVTDNNKNNQPQIETAVSGKNNNFIPLFIGLSQEGDSYPYDQILNGVTSLPDLMAIGATWDLSEAEKIGSVMGNELHRLGINLYIGPSLDVLDINYTGSGDDLGTRTFGGDPFWVSQMGKAFIRGLHKSSAGQMAVIAKHFPGRGGSDRLPEAEVATVRKSLEQLELIELAPFFSVTGNAASEDEKVEGLFLSHIRYQGLQGNIRAFTKPISLDPSALGILMNLSEFSGWRKEGGIIVSDDLGSQAVRHSFDPTGRNFDARQVVLNAFLAGNDLLYMDRITSTNDPDAYTTILRVLDYFIQKYREDRAFAERIDSSVERVLNLKSKIYRTFDINLIRPNLNESQGIGGNEKISFEVATKGITLISPGKNDLLIALPQPPNSRSNIIFFTDQLEFSQCTQCKKQSILSTDEFQKVVVNLYGPDAGGLVNPNRLSSFSLNDLDNYLDAPLSRLDLDSSLVKSDWVIFALRAPDPGRPASNGLHRLISEKPQLMREKKVIAFAFNTPYRLDATDISNLTAYYGVYSQTNSFVEVAARVLFQEIHPQGAPPVSVPGAAYDLNLATSPDPKGIISLAIDLGETSKPRSSTNPTPIPAFFIGDMIPLKAGLILDHNGHPVPDGTVVKFLFNLTAEKRVSQQMETVTRNGIARVDFRIQDPGLLEIKVSSDPAFNSEILRLDITPGKSIIVSAITPTAVPTTTSGNEMVARVPLLNRAGSNPVQLEWLYVVVLLWLLGFLTFWIGENYFSSWWAIRSGLAIVIGGLLTYSWLILDLPGSFLFYPRSLLTTTIVVLSGGLVGFLFNWYLARRATDNKK